MDRAARLRVNQGDGEGVYSGTRLNRRPPICPQDCPRGAAVSRFYEMPAMILPKLKQAIPPIINNAANARRSHNFPEADFSITSNPKRQTTTPKITENSPRLD